MEDFQSIGFRKMTFALYAFGQDLTAEVIGQVILACTFLRLQSAAVDIADEVPMAQALTVFYLENAAALAVHQLFGHTLRDERLEEERIVVFVLSAVGLCVEVLFYQTLHSIFSYLLTSL